jgi:hypothetical protein
MKERFYREFRSKIVTIPQGFNFDEIEICKDPPKNAKPVFLYAGAIIPGIRDLSLFLSFLSTISLDFSFIAYTNQPEWFKAYHSKLNGKLVIKQYIDRLTLIYEMSKVDFLVNVDTIYDGKNKIEAIPSKLIDYALSQRPILNINSASLDKDKVIEFLNGDYSKKRIIDVSNFNIKKVANQFISLIHS